MNCKKNHWIAFLAYLQWVFYGVYEFRNWSKRRIMNFLMAMQATLWKLQSGNLMFLKICWKNWRILPEISNSGENCCGYFGFNNFWLIAFFALIDTHSYYIRLSKVWIFRKEGLLSKTALCSISTRFRLWFAFILWFTDIYHNQNTVCPGKRLKTGLAVFRIWGNTPVRCRTKFLDNCRYGQYQFGEIVVKSYIWVWKSTNLK